MVARKNNSYQEKAVINERNQQNNLNTSSSPIDSINKRSVKSDEFESKVIDIKRVTKMYKGGRRMKISVFVAVGNKKGLVGLGIGKSTDVKTAQDKAIARAKKNLVFVPLRGDTIPHAITKKFGAAKIILKPAAPGTGIIAGSSVRLISELAGIKDILSKILGTRNKIANAYCTIKAFKGLRSHRL
ncbi:MAG: 30S ribosomal protein S5 [Candidatus Dojkabacteria bacterium]|nr:30S ribosomal protein S5 [Candidatus Dojkabacteria bacterium]